MGRKLWVVLVLAWLAVPAHAETITGRLSFTDFRNPIGGTPIANATVEVWRYRPGGGIFGWGWAMDMTAFTDANGRLNVTMPWVGNGILTSLRVYATNPAVRVFQQDNFTQPFYAVPGGNPGFQLVTTSPSSTLDFTFEFADSFSASHFNIASAAQIGRDYASARRDPRETDTIDRVDVIVTNPAFNTYYDPIVHQLRFSIAFAMDDFTVLHEYAHYLEEHISSFQGVASWHDGCQFLSSQGGFDISNPGMAWMEGFADYFAQAVALANVGGATPVTGPMFGTFSSSALESPASRCGPQVRPESVELFVGGALWDLVDTTPIPELGDRYCVGSLPTDTLIFQIFDHELDMGWTNPTLQNFLDAWVARGLDLPPLVSTFGAAATNLTRPAPTRHYDPLPRADYAVWRPSEGNWYILAPSGAGSVTQWGMAGDVPVPGDYDGDGITDLAIWRPSDGNWWVILSGTGRAQATQWGTAGDIPLPADYDGDGEIDFAVYRPSTGQLWIKQDNCGPDRVMNLGAGTPVVGDVDGDGIADPGTFDPTYHVFTMLRSGGSGPFVRYFPTGVPALADYDGDGVTDLAVFDSSVGLWTILRSTTATATTVSLGAPLATFHKTFYATPVPADYDGDGRADPAVWYAFTGQWYVQQSLAGFTSLQWGQSGDRPVPAR